MGSDAYRGVWKSVRSYRVRHLSKLEIKVNLSQLSESEYRRYYETRLSQNRFRKARLGYMALCPFHQDKTPSLSVNTEKGVWNCFAGCGSGGVLDFEVMFSKCDKEAAIAHISDIVGLKQLQLAQRPEAIYTYTDTFGKELFQVVRNAGKRFTQRRPDGKGGYVYETKDAKMVLYHLPEVVTARQCIIVEGEKDCDNLRAAIGGDRDALFAQVAVTTSPRGAGKWLEDYSIYFAGKQVLILPDNDDAGRKHAKMIAASVYRYAPQVKILELPGLPEKGDVSDYLKEHTFADLVKAAGSCPWWRPAADTSDSSLFMTVSQFEEKAADHIDWLVEGVIQRGANGLFIARPKVGKSYLITDLALALASGQKWLDFYVPNRVRVALVSREDNGGLTQMRVKKLRAHRQLTAAQLDGYLYINAKGMRPKVMLDDEPQVVSLIADLKKYQSEFLILDVMRVLHGADENDNTEMQRILSVLNRIQDEVGCSVCLVHHDNKREDATLTERARGASAIAGYAEFICGLRVVDEDEWVREFCCELKAAMPPDKFYWKIFDTEDDAIKVERVEWTPPTRGRKKKDVAQESEF